MLEVGGEVSVVSWVLIVLCCRFKPYYISGSPWYSVDACSSLWCSTHIHIQPVAIFHIAPAAARWLWSSYWRKMPQYDRDKCLCHSQTSTNHQSFFVSSGVATVTTDIFKNNKIINLLRKFAKIMWIFDRTDDSKAQEVIWWPQSFVDFILEWLKQLINICDQSCDCSVVWEMLLQFFQANIWPSGFLCVLSS